MTASASFAVEREYLRVAEVSAMLGVPCQTIYAWVRAGKLPARKIGAAVLIPLTQLRRVLDGDQ
jgi:excisionase family DNA binding protein